MINVIPAVDIRKGRVVRLSQGKAEEETVYFDSPLETARMWAGMGARMLHVVDLDGAIEGDFKNLGIVKEIAEEVNADVELGGGLRDERIIEQVLELGIARVVIGTKALDEKFLSGVLKNFGEYIVVGVDARDGFVYTKGWLYNSKVRAIDFVSKAASLGAKTIIYTDISRDGMLEGPNIESLKAILAASEIDVIVSGGISGIDDVKRLKDLEVAGLKGMIIGKALYEKTIDLREAIKICSQKE